MSPIPTATQPGTRTRPGAHTRIDPRIRQRRVEVKRRQGRRRLRLLLTGLSVLTVAGIAWTVLHSGLFAAGRITVVGSPHTPAAAVIGAAGLSDHPPLLDVGPGATAGVERLPWVRRATVDVQWPDGVRINVVERQPAAVVQVPSGWAVVDGSGHVLADAASAPAGLPHLVGGGTPGAPGSVVPGDKGGLAVASTLPPAFAGQVTEVDQVPGGQVDLHLSSPVTVDLGATSQLHQKYEDVAAILAGATLQAGDVVDVAVPGAPVVHASAG
ncbi:MAG: cell division protein FtsQ/DivIB [Acidimicrobiales bacterium]